MSYLEALPGIEAPTDTQAAHGLGWASIGIGLAELAAPKQVEALLGLDDNPQRQGVLRVLGLRELVHGFTILTEDKPSQEMACSLWGRVAGDVLDTALLGVAATKTKHPARFAAVAAAVMGIGLLDMLCASKLQHRNS